ncbi:hypothetical protein GCM10020358_44520 [Amorphoplanes nipponensis]|uniref:Uncharacterized protein n=1 Tax=Actinoplanes nipponensis TaxID=135950 RepID=A0A919ML07_9ACTN|nr:hypothetical protein Ani05nite_25750 [Actinoplanes nipponensis]
MSAREQGAWVRTNRSTTARFVVLTSDKSAGRVMPCVLITSVLPLAAGLPRPARSSCRTPAATGRGRLLWVHRRSANLFGYKLNKL